MIFTCRKCKQSEDIPVDARRIAQWKGGSMIQHVFPELSLGQRELMISGVCGPCFDELFPPEEEED